MAPVRRWAEMNRTAVLATLTLLALAGCFGKDAVARDSVTSVTIEPPTNGATADRATVCWRVEGQGRAHHTAVHWATESHAAKSGRSFSDYGAGMAWPDNATQAAADGYALPGRFCATVPVPSSGSLYIVAHADLVHPPHGGLLSEEVRLSAATGHVYEMQTPTGPSSGAPNADVEVCWIVRGNGTLAHLDLHWSYESQASTSGRSYRDYDEGSAYPENAERPAAGGYDIQPDGAESCARVRLPASGLIYIVSHAVDETGEPGLLSGEKSIGVENP